MLALAGLMALTAGASAVLPAQAADQSVIAEANGTTFSPATITVNVGDTVTFKHSVGIFPHNVKFDDGSFEMPAAPTQSAFTVSRKFDVAGTFLYYCEQHGGPNGDGMSGKVVVVDSGAPPPVDRTRPKVTRLAASSGAFARALGATIKLTLSEKATIDGRLQRRPLAAGAKLAGKGRFSFFGSTRNPGREGANRLRIRQTRAGKRLTAGEYKLAIAASDANGNRSGFHFTRFFIKR